MKADIQVQTLQADRYFLTHVPHFINYYHWIIPSCHFELFRVGWFCIYYWEKSIITSILSMEWFNLVLATPSSYSVDFLEFPMNTWICTVSDPPFWIFQKCITWNSRLWILFLVRHFLCFNSYFNLRCY